MICENHFLRQLCHWDVVQTENWDVDVNYILTVTINEDRMVLKVCVILKKKKCPNT